ncbi:replication protein C [Amylibacter ulvae]|uniref:Replication protein C n=2 Tax=Paramylibacter ulvae TaxID=1651968 RepID=A0ABQ3DB55_9RHOB|nr:replication protein C [Amylibacter ulvae]
MLATRESDVAHFDKWELFRELCVARLSYGLSDRDMAVLNALLSFHQGRNLSDNDNLVVFPSNKALSERAHGMAESTLRRHLAALTGAGVILRHDSPNGKRYAAKDASGDITRAFGFNLRPLLIRATEITDRARETRAAAETYRRVREECSVMLRDATKLAEYGAEEYAKHDWESIQSLTTEYAKVLRRKLAFDLLNDLRRKLAALTGVIHDMLGMGKTSKTNKMSGSDNNNERHYQNSNKDSYDFEPSLDKEKADGQHPEIETLDKHRERSEKLNPQAPKLPLPLVLKTCGEIQNYAKDGVNNWYDFVATAHFVRSMMGISPDAWGKAQIAMGVENAAIVLACMLEKITEIHSPGGYLRALTQKAEDGAFSPGPMVMALLNGGDKNVA